MHRSSLRRVLTTLWACWFVLLVNEPLLHACPMHDGVLAATAGTAGTASTPASATHAGASTHAAHGSAHSGHLSADSAPDPAPHDEGGAHHCTCLGHCASASAVALPEAKRFAWLAGIVDIDAEPVAAAGDVARDVEHFLPFATAPPRVTRA